MHELIKQKLKILRQLHIKLTDDEYLRLINCKNDIQLDNVARTIILKEG